MGNWCESRNAKNFKALTIIISSGICLARNANSFDDKLIPCIQCASQVSLVT
jgi:hypothetical protein